MNKKIVPILSEQDICKFRYHYRNKLERVLEMNQHGTTCPRCGSKNYIDTITSKSIRLHILIVHRGH